MRALAQMLSAYAHKHQLLRAGDRVGVAVSGGLDSVALLRLLLELRRDLGIVLSVVHFNHQLRGPEADVDQQFVGDLAYQYDLEFHAGSADVAAYASRTKVSLETAAREMRYSFFRQLLTAGSLNRIATAHTLDDQAETVLLRLLRGAGTRGMAGIYPKLLVGETGAIVRPLLATKRPELEMYLGEIHQSWREDAMNRDLRHVRNRVRHIILPQIERELNPSGRERLAEAAEISRAEETFWQQQIEEVKASVQVSPSVLKIGALLDLPLAIRRRVLRSIAESLGLKLEFRHVEDALRLAADEETSKTELPDGWTVVRKRNELVFQPARTRPVVSSGRCPETKELAACGQYSKTLEYDFPAAVQSAVPIPQLGLRLEIRVVPPEAAAAYNPDDLLDSALLMGDLRVRNWRAGDRFRPTHRKSSKKVKELLQELHISGEERKLWPVVTSGAQIIWVRGLAVAAHLQFQQGRSEAAIYIKEIKVTPSNRNEHDSQS